LQNELAQKQKDRFIIEWSGAMLELKITVVDEDEETADRIARLFASDVSQVEGVDSAGLVRDSAPEGTKGMVEVVGAVVATLATAGAVGPLIDLAKSFLGRRNGRTLVFKARDFEISIPADEMSEARFDTLVDQLLVRLPKGGQGETA